MCQRSGIGEVPVPGELQQRPCLQEEEIRKLLKYALLLEEYYQSPRDIEWAVDQRGEIYLLQTRALRISPDVEQKEENLVDPYAKQILINWGLIASPGVGSGPVHLVLNDSDLDSFPHGAVLVVKSTHTKYVTVMDRASAIIAEIGSVAGHMASLARESQVPTIVDAKDATKLLRPGQLVTVDAYNNKIYDGPVRSLSCGNRGMKRARRKKTLTEGRWKVFCPAPSRSTCGTRKPILSGPRTARRSTTSPASCTEVSIEEMFHLHEWKRTPEDQARQLDSEVPINLYIIDLGGGLSLTDQTKKRVRPEEIVSAPMRALWKGITHPKVHWTGMVEVDLKGFASVMLNTLSDSGRYGTPLGEKSYAIISKEYMNFSSRLAYHFSTIDAYCSDVKNNNYVSFQFMGGGSSAERRSRRARFIGGVLKNLDFEVEMKGDWLRARLGKYACRNMEEKLDYLGRLMCCARQLDMAMYSNNVVDWYVQAFMKGNYEFKKTTTT